jgi:translation initiation factor IF-1
VVKVLSRKTCTVQLSNGHRLLGYQPVGEAAALPLEPGQRIKVRLSPFDLSEGRILLEETKNLR